MAFFDERSLEFSEGTHDAQEKLRHGILFRRKGELLLHDRLRLKAGFIGHAAD
ncbi:MAG TPA: hypothetical protein VME23_01665 [Terracidiphilus sp.]|nr:hypothetical protein [Terracidiphilus sp.]